MMGEELDKIIDKSLERVKHALMYASKDNHMEARDHWKVFYNCYAFNHESPVYQELVDTILEIKKVSINHLLYTIGHRDAHAQSKTYSIIIADIDKLMKNMR